MERTWTMRAYEVGAENEMFELDKVVSGEAMPNRERWMEGWRWMFVDNPAGNSIIWLAEHNGKLVGQYPLVMEDMKIGREIAKGSQIADTMTHPEYRRQGIASILGEKALSQLRKKKVFLAFGFPTPQVYPIHIKSGWFDVCPFQVMVKPLNLRNILRSHLSLNKLLLHILTVGGNLILKTLFRTKKPPQVNELMITRISHFDDRFDNLWERVSNDYSIIVARNKRYLNWRYIITPNIDYTVYAAEIRAEVYGYVVLGNYNDYEKKDLRIGCIYDIIAALGDEDVLHHLISKAIDYFKEEKVDAVFSQTVANRIYRKVLLKNGFVPYLRSKSRFIAYNASLSVPNEFLKDFKNWFIQLGDLPRVY